MPQRLRNTSWTSIRWSFPCPSCYNRRASRTLLYKFRWKAVLRGRVLVRSCPWQPPCSSRLSTGWCSHSMRGKSPDWSRKYFRMKRPKEHYWMDQWQPISFWSCLAHPWSKSGYWSSTQSVACLGRSQSSRKTRFLQSSGMSPPRQGWGCRFYPDESQLSSKMQFCAVPNYRQRLDVSPSFV